MSYLDDLNAAAQLATEASARADSASEIFHAVAHGLDSQTVTTENGEVLTLANAIKRVRADILGFNPKATLTGDEVFWAVQADGTDIKVPVSQIKLVDSVNGQEGEVVLGTDDVAEGSTNKYYPSADASKLSGIEAGAQVNTVNSVNGKTGEVILNASDTGSIPASEKGSVNGVASLGADGLVPLTQLPELSGGDVASVNGMIGEVVLDATSVGAVGSSEKGIADGVATLDGAGKVPLTQLPEIPDAGISEAPSDGTVYGRQNETWVEVTGGSGAVDSVNGYTGVVELSASDVGAVEDAPIDGTAYNRKDGAWVVAEGGSGGAGGGVALDGPKVIDVASTPVEYIITNYSSFSSYSVSVSEGSATIEKDVVLWSIGSSSVSGDVSLNITQDGAAHTFLVDWRNPSDPPTAAGQPYGGGHYAGANIVVGGSEYYLVVAPKTMGGAANSSLPWEWTTDPDVSGAVSTNDGRSNTAAIVAAGGSDSSVAAGFCNNLTINGYSDWHLPSIDELEICYRYLKPMASNNIAGEGGNLNSNPTGAAYTTNNPLQTSATIFQQGGAEAFDGSHHWSSTNDTANNASYLSFVNGSQLSSSKSFALSVHAVRWVEKE